MFYSGSDYYFTKNLFGDIIKVVKSDGTVVAQYSYDTWGKCTVETNVDGMADKNPFRYRGYYYDVESGLYYLQTRYYSPEFKRFISPDNYSLLPDLAQIGDLNLYAYCSNNPVMYTDPTGELALTTVLTFLAVVAINVVIGAIDGGITAAMQGQDFWLGAAAGAIGGLFGGVITAFTIATPFKTVGGMIARGLSSATYGIFNELFQNGSLEKLDGWALAEDVFLDVFLTKFYPNFIDDFGTIIGMAAGATVDSVVDIIETIPNMWQRIKKEKMSNKFPANANIKHKLKSIGVLYA